MRRTAATIEEAKERKHTEGNVKKGRGRDKKPRKKYPHSEKQLAGLKPWPKGVSGNPGGLPGTDIPALIARRMFEENPDIVYMGGLKALKSGSPYAFDVFANRGYGKVKEIHELTGADGTPLEVTVKFVRPDHK